MGGGILTQGASSSSSSESSSSILGGFLLPGYPASGLHLHWHQGLLASCRAATNCSRTLGGPGGSGSYSLVPPHLHVPPGPPLLPQPPIW